MKNREGTWDISFYESEPYHPSPCEVASKLGVKVGVRLGTPEFRQVGAIFYSPRRISVQRMLLRIAWQLIRAACSPYLMGWGPQRKTWRGMFKPWVQKNNFFSAVGPDKRDGSEP